MKIDWKKLLICLAIPLAVGGLGALLGGGMDSYQTLNQPPLSPPGWLFPIVWTILYLLMGWASYRVLVSDAPREERKKALTFYGIQLFLNFLWPVVFFGLQWYWAAFVLLLALWVMIYLTMHLFGLIDDTAENLLIPYLLWVTFAGYLNLGIALMN
jgi:tryptophan-rich sensory protein